MELNDRTQPCIEYKDGSETVEIIGKRLKITAGTDVEILNWDIPAGETWQVYIQVNATRTA